MIYDTKQYRVLLELHITQGQLESPGKTKHSSVDSYGKKHRQVTALPHVRNAILFAVTVASLITLLPVITYVCLRLFHSDFPSLKSPVHFHLRMFALACFIAELARARGAP